MAIEWTDHLSTGLDWQDAQHKRIVARVDELLEAIQKGRATVVVEELLDFLGEYADLHFRDEEDYMKAHNCPGYLEHRREHEEFKEHLRGLRGLYKRQGPSRMVVSHLQRWLRDWLVDHIARVDRQMGPLARKASETP